MIHVCFGLYDKTGHYSKFTGTAMLSIFENTTSNVTVHILHDNTLSTNNRDKFIYLAGQYGQLVKFYNVEELCADKINDILNLTPAVRNSRFSVATFYRLLIPHILPAEIEKCIYIDSDIIFNLDIAELQQINLTDKPLAAVPEAEIYINAYKQRALKKYLVQADLVNGEDYFNAGVLLMNLNYWRQNEQLILGGIKWVSEHPQCTWFDQDILNYLFSKIYVKLSRKFDLFITFERDLGEKFARRAVYHYIVSTLRMEMHDPFNRLWMSYFMRTPWFDVDTIGRLYDSFLQMHVGLKQSMANVSAMMSGKTRAFFVPPQSVGAVKKIFSIRDDEEIITVENQTSLQKLLDSMNASRGKKVFFIMLPQFPFQILIQAGFEYGRDFINGMDFLSEAQGVPFNSHPLIQAL